MAQLPLLSQPATADGHHADLRPLTFTALLLPTRHMDFPWLRLRGELSGSGPLIDVVDERGVWPGRSMDRLHPEAAAATRTLGFPAAARAVPSGGVTRGLQVGSVRRGSPRGWCRQISLPVPSGDASQA